MNNLIKNILNHLKENPQITEENYCNISPFFGRYNKKGTLKDELYIGYGYTINIFSGILYIENDLTGKQTKTKIN